MNVELFKGGDGWRWRLRGVNGEILATSEAYSSKGKAESTAMMVHDTLLHGDDRVQYVSA